MRKLYANWGAVFAALALFAMCGARPLLSQAPAREGPSLFLSSRIPLTGVAGRIDHFTADPKRRLLIFSGVGNNTIEIVNTFESKLVRSIQGLAEPQGPLYVPEFDKLFVANAGNRSVHIYDGNTYALRKAIEVGEDPDNVRWDEASNAYSWASCEASP